jgi:hypothetical protein
MRCLRPSVSVSVPVLPAWLCPDSAVNARLASNAWSEPASAPLPLCLCHSSGPFHFTVVASPSNSLLLFPLITTVNDKSFPMWCLRVSNVYNTMLLRYFIYPAEQVPGAYRVGYALGTVRVRHVAYLIILIGLTGRYGHRYGWVRDPVRLGAVPVRLDVVKLKKIKKSNAWVRFEPKK